MAVIRYLADKLSNLVSGLGGGQDKASMTTYGTPLLSDEQLLNAYRGAWLPRKIVDIPAEDSVRQWRNWQADEGEITAIEAEEKRLMVVQKILRARILSRLFGGSAIYIATRDSDTSTDLVPDRIGLGGILYLTIMRHDQLSPGELDNDPSSPTYGCPINYTISGTLGRQLVIHPSRLIVFAGREHPLPDYSPTRWGDSVLLSVFEAVRNADAIMANTASLTFEAKVDVYKIPGFMDGMIDPTYTEQVIKRFAIANTLKGINHALILDSLEEYEQKQISFAGLPDIIDRGHQVASGAADIPLTRLMGQSPGGLSATGESDLRNYYDGVKSEQELRMTPAMGVFDECLIRSATGSRRPEIYYEWRPLWQPTATDRANIGKTTADTIKVLADTKLFPDDALSATAANMLTESGIMPGLDAEIEASSMDPGYLDPEPVVDEPLASDA